MFYIPELLQKRGEWAIVWLAATYPKQLVKKQILKSAIKDLIDDIFGSPVPLSLRLFSILMHGLAVIYEKQAELLIADCMSQVRALNVCWQPRKLQQKNTAPQAKITLEPSLYSSNVIEFPSSAVAGVGNDDLITMAFSPQPGPEQYLEPIIPRRKSRTSNQNMDVIQARVEDITFNDSGLDFQIDRDDSLARLDLPDLELNIENVDTTDLNPYYSPRPLSPSKILENQEIQALQDNFQLQFEENEEPPLPDVQYKPEMLESEIIPQKDEGQENQQIQDMEDEISGVSHVTKTIKLKIDRRISLDNRELRELLNLPPATVNRPTPLPPLAETQFSFSTGPASFSVTGELLGLWDLFTGNVENDETLARSSTIEEPAEKEAAPSSPIEEPKQFNFSDDFLNLDQEVQNLQTSALEESVELRRGSTSSRLRTPASRLLTPATPLNFDFEQIETTPLQTTSPLGLFGDSFKIKKNLRSRSIHPFRASSTGAGDSFSIFNNDNEQYYDIDSLNLPHASIIKEKKQEVINSIDGNTVKMLHYLSGQFMTEDNVDFNTLTGSMNRRNASKSFYQVLVLASTGYVQVLQTHSYGPITLREGD